jgi:hypothetical protein
MLPLISLTLGLSLLSGLNLYLATFLASFAVSQGWVDAALDPALAGLGHPAIMIVALILFLVEFILDKIPWVDSLWDAVHTIVRPLGAVGLSLVLTQGSALGPVATTVLATAAFLMALSTHLTKSGLRLLINASPEPFTNILASLVEDVAVVALMVLLINAPVTGLAACLALLAGTWMVLPRLLRLVKASLFLVWKKYLGRVAMPVSPQTVLPSALTVEQETQLIEKVGPEAAVAWWAVPCVSGKASGLPGLRPNRFGTLVAPAAHPGTLVFLSRGWFRRHAVRVSLAGASIRQESGFLSENLVVHRADDGLHLVLRFTRGEGPLVAHLVQGLNSRLGLAAPGSGLSREAVATEVWDVPRPLQH